MCNFSDVVEREATERGLAEGIAKGVTQGRQAEKLDVARSMKDDGLDIAMICKYTGLKKEEVEGLQ